MGPRPPEVPGDEKKSGFSFPVVGIGASAGGLYSLECFVAALPTEFGFAVIFMQHLSTKHRSLLPELLRKRRPDLEIIEISDGLKVLPGKLFLCPPGKVVRIQKTTFQVAALSEKPVLLPIDELFASLAEEAGDRTVGVIFSGAGTDGARGIQAIRSAGGTVFAQDPATAEFASMPLAAIATGQPDGVFKPEEIAREIMKLQSSAAATISLDRGITPEDLGAFYRLLHDRTGHNFFLYKKSVVARRIGRRMYLRGVTSVNDYLQFISENSPEINNLAFDLMIGVTSFFRDPLAWKALMTGVIRKLTAANDASAVRVWTPACATGEEAYSIAMMLHHEFELAGRQREIQVFATDVNERALEKAREGKYPAGISSEIPPDFMKKYFTYTEDGLSAIIGKEIRELVVFAKHDILTDPPFSRLDLVICRNLLIYLEPEAQEKCITLFHYGLKNSGFLFLGNAESPGRNVSLFKSLSHKKCRIYEKVESKPKVRMPVPAPFTSNKPERQTSMEKAENCSQSVTGIVQEALLEGYAPAAVAINQNYDILYHNGPTNRYLCQPRGAPTQNLLELLPASLRNRIRSGLYRASNDGKHVSLRANVACEDGKKREVTISISPLMRDLFLFVFREKGVIPEYPEETQLESSADEAAAVHQLETELSATRQDLQSNIEQLKSLNEEMQSSNEELQAANEELETSREELQSLNEEMITVNAQLQAKIEEQEATNNDLNNFLASTNIPTIFLDPQFRVKRFTPAMSKLIKLIPSDVGRPIMDMSQEGLGHELIADAQSVLETLVSVKKELVINDTWYVRTALPYRTADNRIEGVIITYNDVTELKRAEDRTRHLASFPQLNPNPVIEVDASGNSIFVNPGAELMLESLGMDKVAVFFPKDLDFILKDLDKDSGSAVSREVTVRDRVFSVTVQLIPQFNVARIYAHEITERKRAEESLRESELFYRQTLESIPGMVFTTRPDGYCDYQSQQWVDFTGVPMSEHLGSGWNKLLHPDDRPRAFAAWRAAVEERADYDLEYRVRRYDGAYEWFKVRGRPIRNAAGEIVRWFGTAVNIDDLLKTQEALWESEARVRLKLESILSPAGDIGDLELADIIDAPAIQTLVANLYRFVHLPIGILDLKGNVLVGMGWQDICIKFHRVHPETCRHCSESDLELTKGVPAGEFRLYKCKNGMWDAVTPIMVGGQHMGNLFWGQFFFEDEPPDYEFFRAQALKYGFNEKEYLAALEAVPRISREALDTGMAFYLKLADMLSRLSYSNIKLARSLTERDTLLRSLRESEEGLKRSQKIAHLGNWELDLINNRLSWSDEVYRIFGLQPQEFDATYEAFLEAVHPDDRAAVDAAYSGSLREGRDSYEIEHRVVRKATGEIRYVHEKCRHIRDEAGRISRSVGMVHDITERKQVEREREVTVEFLYLVNNSAGTEDLIRDAAAFFQEQSGCEALGIRLKKEDDFPYFETRGFPKEFVLAENSICARDDAGDVVRDTTGNPVLACMCGNIICGRFDPVKDFFSKGGSFWTNSTTELLARDTGADRQPGARNRCHGEGYESVALIPLRAGQEQLGLIQLNDRRKGIFSPETIALWERLAGYLSIAMVKFRAEEDVLKLSEDMAARNAELETANRDLQSFIYSISHDLRAPLRSMAGFSRILVDEYADRLGGEVKDYLGRIHRGSEKMTRLVDDLLRLSKISQHEIAPVEVDMSRKALSVIAELREADPDRNVRVEIKKDLTVFADPSLIEIIITNLLGNAWKFTSVTVNACIEFGAVEDPSLAPGGPPRRLHPPRKETVYYVKDNGAGFDPKYAGKMFLPFHRLHSDKEFEGTGIGLAIVERIIHRHGGRIWAVGEEGKGATVYFTLGQGQPLPDSASFQGE